MKTPPGTPEQRRKFAAKQAVQRWRKRNPEKERAYRKRDRVKDRTKQRAFRQSGHRTDKDRRGGRGAASDILVGIDGEGRGRDDHKYILLAYSSSDGHYEGSIENAAGLSTIDCLEFLLRIPPKLRPFGFALSYDWTKILADVDDQTLYLLARPEQRAANRDAELRALEFERGEIPKERGLRGPPPILWGDYEFNLQGSKFMLRRKGNRPGATSIKAKAKRYKWLIFWDIFKFFQSKFVSALEKWQVGSDETRLAMTAMKDQRAEFEKVELDEIRAYCFSECRDMATLAQKLRDAHLAAGLPLKSFYGAGSTASAMLKKMQIHKRVRTGPEAARVAFASAFAGGRFEHSVIGPIQKPVFGYDISSAYPYITAHLPCLDKGKWTLTKNQKRIRGATAACIRYTWKKPLSKSMRWGPFPFRTSKGAIVYPRMSGGGWIWRDEFQAGNRLFPDHFKIAQAWIFEAEPHTHPNAEGVETPCNGHPFADLPAYYLKRLEWGKEGAGIVLKLGVNSVYGKTAQSVGVDPPFQSWIWAGMITSGTRAQMLELMAAHDDLANIYAIATDGMYSSENLAGKLPLPRDTGTAHVAKPLGGWEQKSYPKGMFFLRPGIYFPLSANAEELKEARGRGVGKKTMKTNIGRIEAAFSKGKRRIKLPNVTRFHGMKSSISYAPKLGTFQRSPRYGQWSEKEVKLSFSPLPKRRQAYDPKTGLLTLRKMHGESAPYDPAIFPEEVVAMRLERLEASEQPDGGTGQDSFFESFMADDAFPDNW